MKKEMKVLFSVILSLLAVFMLSFFASTFLLPQLSDLFGNRRRTYSLTNCLTSNISEDMDIYDIAKYYRDGKATVAIKVTAHNSSTNKNYESLGSGVCIASNGYKTSIDDYVAKMGSYIVTNYHVIEFCDSKEFDNQEISIVSDDENVYSSELLWFNKDLDVAVIYSDEVNLNYITMKDRIVDCSKENKLDYEPIFTIGTPLELDYLNRLTVGNVASDNPMLFYTTETIYPFTTTSGTIGYTNYPSYRNSRTQYDVVSNVYEDVVDIALGITHGNSGGGVFDKKGNLIGLSTLGGNIEETNGNQMNGMVAIYPVMKVLDKLIDNKENSNKNSIYTFDQIGIKGMDSIEASYVSFIKEKTGYSNYFLDGTLYSSLYNSAFNFNEDGYYILSSSKINLPAGSYITSCKIGQNEQVNIVTRNDLIYQLLKANKGDKVTFNYVHESSNKSVTVTFG